MTRFRHKLFRLECRLSPDLALRKNVVAAALYLATLFADNRLNSICGVLSKAIVISDQFWVTFWWRLDFPVQRVIVVAKVWLIFYKLTHGECRRVYCCSWSAFLSFTCAHKSTDFCSWWSFQKYSKLYTYLHRLTQSLQKFLQTCQRQWAHLYHVSDYKQYQVSRVHKH